MGRSFDLHRKTALVTGASSGIGRALAEVLARDVGTLVLVARRRARLDEIAASLTAKHASLRVIVRDVDLIDRGATSAMLDELEASGVTIDVLVNNAGFGDRGLVSERPWSKLEALIELNVVTATFLIHRVLPGMLARGSGAILNVGSIAGIVTKPGSAVYGSTKSYLNALGEALHSELASTGVIVTSVLPGPVPTEFGALAAKLNAAPVTREDAGPQAAPPSIRLPNIFRVSPEECAEQAVRAMVRGEARVVPGAPVSLLARVMDNLPRPILRGVLARAAARIRK